MAAAKIPQAKGTGRGHIRAHVLLSFGPRLQGLFLPLKNLPWFPGSEALHPLLHTGSHWVAMPVLLASPLFFLPSAHWGQSSLEGLAVRCSLPHTLPSQLLRSILPRQAPPLTLGTAVDAAPGSRLQVLTADYRISLGPVVCPPW